MCFLGIAVLARGMLRASTPMRRPPPTALLRKATGAALALGLVLAPSAAHALTIAISPAYPGNPPSLPRIGTDGKIVQKRPLNLTPEGVSLQDCIDDQRIRFPLALGDIQTSDGNGSLEVWASLSGVDCGTQVNRTSATQVCWKLNGGSNIAVSVNPNVDIAVREIMSGFADPKTPNASQSVCGTVDLANFAVQFLYFAPGQQATPATSLNLSVQVDTIGPAPPSGLGTKPGNGRITVTWTNISGEGGLSALTGVRAYCDLQQATTTAPSPSNPDTELVCEGGIDDAGTEFDAGCTEVEVDGGTSSGTPTTTECSSPNFVTSDGSNILPDQAFNDRFLCGSVTGNTGSSLIADSFGGRPLENGTTYAVAVAATDQFGNNGPLSPVVCEFPEATNDFWDNYGRAGGQAGSTCAATGAIGAPAGGIGLLAVFGGVVVSFARRMRRKRERSLGTSVTPSDERNTR